MNDKTLKRIADILIKYENSWLADTRLLAPVTRFLFNIKERINQRRGVGSIYDV